MQQNHSNMHKISFQMLDITFSFLYIGQTGRIVAKLAVILLFLSIFAQLLGTTLVAVDRFVGVCFAAHYGKVRIVHSNYCF